MTDKNINDWLFKINSANGFGYILDRSVQNEKLISEKTAIIVSENLDIDYLEKEMGLVVRFLSENQNANLIKLSRKGIEVINKGGWIKYLEKEKNKKRINKLKKEASYWFGIVVPLMALFVAVWTIIDKGSDIESRVLIKAKEQSIEILKTDLNTYKEMLTKRMDSVLLANGQVP